MGYLNRIMKDPKEIRYVMDVMDVMEVSSNYDDYEMSGNIPLNNGQEDQEMFK